MRPTKKLWARIGAGLIVAAAFASAAIAADSGSTVGSGASALTAAASDAVSGAATRETAARVIDAITGGSNPSIIASMRSDPESRANAKGPSFNVISAAQGLLRAGTPGTVGTRPGWGCGDNNHIHTGPPGRPAGAESPCDKNR